MKPLVKSHLGSPIIYENDSRRMRRLTQDKDNCGETCVAMVSGRTTKEVEDLMDSKNGTHRSDLKLACLLLKVPVVGRWTKKRCYPDNRWPPTCLMKVHCKDSGNGHIIVRHGNIFYDPQGTTFYRLPDKYKFVEYLEIDSVMVWVEKEKGKYQGDSLILCKAREIKAPAVVDAQGASERS